MGSFQMVMPAEPESAAQKMLSVPDRNKLMKAPV